MKISSKYISIAVFIIITILSFLVIKPFITAILTSIVLAYLFNPIYKILNKKINSSLSALIIILVTILLIIVPSFFIAQSLVKESISFYNLVRSSDINPVVNDVLDKVVKFISDQAQSLITSIPSFLISVIVTLFLFYYFLKDGDKIVKAVKDLMPLERKHKEIVLSEFKKVTSAVVYGLILIGLVVGILTAFGFFIFKIPNPIIWGLIAVVVSILPGLGNGLIWIPAAVIEIVQGDYFNGIGLFIYGLIFISGFEMMLKPKLISYKSDLHPALIVLGVFGGLALLGFTGLFFGPLILVIFITFLKHIIDEF